uniref:Perilipin n=1 Tax=Melopsittacus undulatus TaxID=13146 RepID=A0A8V5GYZ7_MELUD
MSSSKASHSSHHQHLQQSVVSRVASLALVSCACGAVSTAYSSTKESHPYVRSVCDAAEKGVKTLTAAAVSGAQPILTKLEPQLSTANEYACKGLDKLEEKLPILQQPPQRVTSALGDAGGAGAGLGAGAWRPCAVPSQVVAGTRALVSCTVGLARGAVQGGVARTCSALSTVAESRVGQILATGVDTMLGKSEELVERYLPGTDEELAPTGTEVAALGQQRRWQSYFIRVGSLSAKLRHRALRRSLGELQRAQHRARHVLAQLHRAFELVEARTLAMLRGLLHQLHAACTRVAASIRGLPSSVQETTGHVRHGVEGIQRSLSRARSLHDLSELVVAQSRETMLRAQLSIDEMLEHVGEHAPLPWLVGPFAPALVEYPEDK